MGNHCFTCLLTLKIYCISAKEKRLDSSVIGQSGVYPKACSDIINQQLFKSTCPPLRASFKLCFHRTRCSAYRNHEHSKHPQLLLIRNAFCLQVVDISLAFLDFNIHRFILPSFNEMNKTDADFYLLPHSRCQKILVV